MGRGRYASCAMFSRISRLLMTGMNSKSVTSDQLAAHSCSSASERFSLIWQQVLPSAVTQLST